MKIVDGVHLLKCKYYDVGLGIGLLTGKSIVMIDSGVSSAFQDEILPYLRRIGAEPKDISLVVNTHGHQDHMGGNAIIREVCQARVAAHKLDIPWIEDLEKLFDDFHRKNSAYIPVTEETIPPDISSLTILFEEEPAHVKLEPPGSEVCGYGFLEVWEGWMVS